MDSDELTGAAIFFGGLAYLIAIFGYYLVVRPLIL
jgi:hypothetical protein